VESGGEKDESGKTVPRSLRHLPVHDAAHIRNALSRLGQPKTGEGWLTPELRKRLSAKAKKLLAGSKKSVDEEVTSGSLFQDIKAMVGQAIERLKPELQPELEDAEPEALEQPKAEKEVAPVETETQKEAITVEKLNAWGMGFSKVVAKAVAEQVAPLKVALEDANEKLGEFEKRLAETEKEVEDKALEMIEKVPPVVKTRVTELAATQIEQDFTPRQKTFLGQLITDIGKEVEKKGQHQKYDM